MNDGYPTSEIVASLYSAVLARSPNGDELAFHVKAAADMTLEKLIVGIVQSDEALDLFKSRLFKALTLSEAVSFSGNRRMTLDTADVMNVIAVAHERLIGREPTFAEVARRLQSLAEGSSLQDEIDSIANSHDAIQFRSAQPSKQLESRPSFAQYIGRVYFVCLKRHVVDHEIDIWYRHYLGGLSLPEILRSISESDEAKTHGGGLESWDEGPFIQLVYEIILGRGATPQNIEHYRDAIITGTISRTTILESLFEHAAHSSVDDIEPQVNDNMQALLFGQKELLSSTRWNDRKNALIDEPVRAVMHGARFPFVSKANPLVTIVTSLYRAGTFIENFLENITSQTIFSECELLIVDANSPEGEEQQARRFIEKFKNIRYMRHSSCVGIYEAWNMCIREATGIYCTNANLDDCRRSDSIELQASTLDALSFVDVTYQDIFYSYGKNMEFEEIERFGFKTELPIVSRYNLLEFNSPHNAPMWRLSLHDEIGYFNENFKSAADYEFWVRCIAAGKTFYKINDAHVAYYVNPEGLSTRSDTKGRVEADNITKTFNRQLIGEDLLANDQVFITALQSIVPGEKVGNNRYTIAQHALRQLSAASRSHV